MWTVFAVLEILREGRENERIIHPTTKKHYSHLLSIFLFYFSSLQIQQLLGYKHNLSLVLKSWVWGIKAFKTLEQLKETPLVCQVPFTFMSVLLLGTCVYVHTPFSTYTQPHGLRGCYKGPQLQRLRGWGDRPLLPSRGGSVGRSVPQPEWRCRRLPVCSFNQRWKWAHTPETGRHAQDTHTARHTDCHRQGAACNSACVQELHKMEAQPARCPLPLGLVKTEGR